MKLKSLAKVCGSNRTIAISAFTQEEDGLLTQYIGNGHALYAVRGMPQLDKNALLTMFDVKEKEKAKWYTPEGVYTESFDLADTTAEEKPLSWNLPCVHMHGAVMMPLETEEGDLYFIDRMYLQPVNESEDMLGLFLRRTEEGAPYIVAKDGYMFQAVIMPVIVGEDFADELKRLWAGCVHMIEHK